MPQPRKPRGSRGRQPQGPQADAEGRRFARQSQQDVIEGTKFKATPTPRATAPGAIDESTSYYPNEPPVAAQPPKGRGGGPAWGQTPFGGYEIEPGLSPDEARSLEVQVDKGVLERIRRAQSIAPSVRQQTRAELINLVLLYERLGNPFSIRRIPFSVLRDMTTDPMIGFALFNTVVPLIRADWYIESPDAQLAAAVDAALRPIHSYTTQQMCQKLSFGYAPIVKQFTLGKLDAFYRDPNGEDPEKDLPVWDSDVDMLLWREFQNLAPEHCLPRWNERGDFDGYYFSIVPLPNPIQIGLANLYGYAVVPGYEVTTEFAMWSVNERAINFGCSPPDEPVLTTKGYKLIGDLDPEIDRLVSADLHAGGRGRIFRGDRSRAYNGGWGYRFEKGERPYSGDLLTIQNHVGKCRVTPNHKFTVRWNREAEKYWTVYLMHEKEMDWWRIGFTRLHRDRGHACSGVGNRMTTEDAHEAWVLGVFESKHDAIYHEALWSQKYHVPDLCFNSTPGCSLDVDDLTEIWSQLDSRTGALKLLEDRGLSPKFPFYRRNVGKRERDTQAGWRNRWTCAAVNLLPGLMDIPVDPDGESRIPEWHTFTVEREHYEGPVISLEVDPYHHYVSNGLVVQNSIYGSPRIKRAYRYYWSYWYRWALADRAFENLADPPKWIYYPTDVPQGLDPEDPNFATGTETTTHFRTLALQILDQMRSGTGVAFPGDFMIDEVSGRMSGTRKWEAGYYKPDVHFDDLAKSFSMLDALKFRACFIPENAFIEGSHSTTSGGSGGTSRLMGIQLGEVWRESQQLLADENDADINRDMIPQFVAANYPEKARIPCRKVTRGMGQIDTEIVKQLIQLVGQVKGEILPVDIYELFRREGIPLLTERQQKQEMEQIADEAEKMQPSPMQPQRVGMQGYNAGVERTATGMTRYVQPPQRIDLATSGQGFLAELPGVPAYGDAAVRAAMMRLRKLMLDRYREQIESFCRMLEAQPALHLAQQSQPQQTSQGTSTPLVPSNVQTPPTTVAAGLTPINAAGVATSVVGAWQTGRGADVAAVAIAGILLAIAVRAARKELKRARLSVDNLDETQLDEYARRRASFVMQSIDDTVRGEMQTYLTNELQRVTDPTKVAQDARERFVATPETHAERVVMAETLPAYNQGMLLGLMDAGVEQFMAHDASDGTNQLTDKICIQRNGQAMNARQALDAVATMHPYCTLYFTALSTDNFSIELVEKIPESLNGDSTMLASYDSEHEILYIREEASEEERREFALAIGSMLALQ